MPEIKIGNVTVSNEGKTFIIAEIGANHNSDIELAKKTIKAAAECGVDAVKFQTYTARELVADKDRVLTYLSNGIEKKETISELFDRLSLRREYHRELFDYANSLGLQAFSTPFSLDGLEFLASLDVPCFKVAASDVNYVDLLEKLPEYNKPVMLSLGKCTLGEADEAINILLNKGCKNLVIMHCVSQYPSPMNEMNLNTIKTLKSLYPECVIGFSDHSMGITAALGAVAFGARVVEKHFTLDKKLDGPDHWFSMDPSDMKSLVTEIRNLESAMGNPRKMILECEKNERHKSVRSLVLKRDLKEGEVIKNEDLLMLRPGWGISPFDKDKVVGMKINKDCKANTVLVWGSFEMIILHAAGNEKIGLGNLTRVKALVKYLCSIKYNNFKVILEAREDIAKMFIVDDVDYFIAENRKIAQKFLEDNMFNKSSEKLVLISDLVDMNYSDNEFYRRCGFDVLIQINDENVNKFNPDIYINSDIFYQEFNVNSQTKIYSGSKFLVVRDEILKQRPLECWNKDKIENILVCFGGSDPARYTEDIVKLIRNNMVYDNYNFNVVLGPGVSDERKRELIKNANNNIKFLVNEKHMERKIIENDLIITLGGLTTYEALALGRPVCCIGWEYMNYYVDNLSKNNWIYKLGNKSKDLEGLEKCLLDIDRLKAIASKGFKNINHRGAENMVNIAIKAEKGEI